MKSRTCLGTLVVMLALASTANAAALLVNASGILTGANGVNVGGTLYNVEFVDDTCAAAFTGCDATSDFTFTPQFTAQLASQALLDQVFLDGSAGNFDTHPELTLGCDSFQCAALIPFFAVQTEFTAIAFINSTSLIDTTAQGIAPNDTGYSTGR